MWLSADGFAPRRRDPPGMAIETLDETRSDDHLDTPPLPPSVDFLALRDEVREQGRSMRGTQRAFTIFAVFGFIIAAITFAAVITKIDSKTITVPAPAVVAKPVAAVHSV